MDNGRPNLFSAMIPDLKEASGDGKSQGVGAGSMGFRRMLIDERMHCESHKTNYRRLKTEYTRLQGEYTRVQDELRMVLSENQSGQEKLQLLLAELRGEMLDKTREVEELRLQVMSPQQLELLKAQLQQEMDIPIMECFRKLEEEAEGYRSEYNKLRSDLTFLKSKFDHQQKEHERMLEEQRIRYSADLALLEMEKRNLSAQLKSGDGASDGKRVETLLREKVQLYQRLSSLEAEVTELRAERDSTGAQAENTQRIQLRQLAESQAALKTLESEKQSVRMQFDQVEKELRLSHEQNAVLTGKLHKAKREINALNNHLEEIKHAHRLELCNVNMEFLKARGEVEREQDKLQTQVDSLQANLEVLMAVAERNKDLLLEKEQEISLRLQRAREQEMQKIAVLREEKLELENHLYEVEQLKALQEAKGNFKKQELKDLLCAARLGEESARQKMQNIKIKVEQQTRELQGLERLKTENTELRRHTAELNVQISTVTYSHCELMDTNAKLRESLERARKQLQSTQTQMERTQQEAKRLKEERCVGWLAERRKLQERAVELQEEHNQAKECLQKAALTQKKRKTVTEAKEKKLQDKIQRLEAKIGELETESSEEKKFTDEYLKLIRRLNEMQKKHKEFCQEEQHLQQFSGWQKTLEDLENTQQLQKLSPLDWIREKDRFLAPQDNLSDQLLHFWSID